MKSFLRATAKSVTRLAVSSSHAGRISMPMVSSIRQFSNLSISEKLADELAHETSESEIDQELLDSISAIKKSFAISDVKGEGVVKLTRKFNNETIDIKFDCQDEEEADVGMEDVAINEQDGDDEPAVGYGIQFEVIVNKDGNKTEFACVAADTLQIRNVRFIPNGKSIDDDLDVYGGPRFEDLDEEVQELFYDYLAARKIDDDLSHFILAYSAKKEQAEYEHWLSKLSEFTAGGN